MEAIRIPAYVLWPLVALSLYGFLHLLAQRTIFQPSRYPDGWWEQQRELGASDVWMETADGVRLHGWWAPSPGAALATLYLHGNAGNLSHRGSHIRAIKAAGSSVLVVDYRGYGKSTGRPSEPGLYADAEAAYRYLTQRGAAPETVVLHGESLGCAVAIELAARLPAAGLILEAPFTTAGDVAHRILPFLGPLVVRSFRSIEKIAEVRAPVLVIHGEQDRVIDPEMGRELFELAPGPKTFWSVPSAGHNDIVETAGRDYVRRLRDFYSALKPPG